MKEGRKGNLVGRQAEGPEGPVVGVQRLQEASRGQLEDLQLAILRPKRESKR